MDELQLDKVQGYFDEATGEPLQLSFDDHTLEIDGLEIPLEGVPSLKSEQTGQRHYPSKTKSIIAFYLDQAKKKGKPCVRIYQRTDHVARYSYAEKFNFLYSHLDYEYIPGLALASDEGYLTPVFFKISVLNKYSQHPEYGLDLFSNTYGTIWFGDNWKINFGINRNKHVIMWLGDIAQLPESEIYYLRSENIESDHDIHSQFYDAQIEAQFAELSPQQNLIHLRRTLNDAFFEKFGSPLFHLEGQVSKIIENLDRPVFWEDKHVGPAVESLNKIFVESVNVKSLKQNLKQANPELDVKSLGSLKILQYWLTERLQLANSSDLMCPLFVLYDYRILTCHLIPDTKRKETLLAINHRLGLSEENANNETIYDALISRLLKSVETILSKLQSQ